MQGDALAYNAEETEKVKAKPIYKEYKKWLEQNRVLVDSSIIYPAYFGEKGKGVIGVATSKPLPPNYSFLAVPYDLIITVEKVKQVKELAVIIQENPQLFKIHN